MVLDNPNLLDFERDLYSVSPLHAGEVPWVAVITCLVDTSVG